MKDEKTVNEASPVQIDGATYASMVVSAANSIHNQKDAINELQHFCGEKPALSHLGAQTDVSLREGTGMVEGSHRGKTAVFLNDADQILLPFQQEFVQHLAGDRVCLPYSVQSVVDDVIVDAVEDEIQQTREHYLSVLGHQKFFQIIVTQR